MSDPQLPTDMKSWTARFLSSELALPSYLYGHVPSLMSEAGLEGVFALRDWFMSVLCYSGPELLLAHGGNEEKLLRSLLRYEGGLWCAGAAELFSLLLKQVHIPATTFMYGYQGLASLSHVTTVFSLTVRDVDGFAIPKFYLLDPYLGFHYVDPGSRQMLDFSELLRRTRDKRYDQIERVDTAIKRPYVAQPGDDPAYRSWLFDDGVPEPEEAASTTVYHGATYTVDKLFVPSSPMRKLADERRGNVPLDHFLLDLMLVKPELGRMSHPPQEDKVDTYVDWRLSSEIITLLAEGCRE